MYEETINYYNNNAREFAGRTVNADMGICQDRFTALLDKGAFILDAGCGSGRDSKFFTNQGFNVTAIDGSSEMCLVASKYTGLEVECIRFDEMEFNSRFYKALKPGGIMYASFKYGNKEEHRLGRFFSDYNMEEVKKIFPPVRLDNLKIIQPTHPFAKTVLAHSYVC